MQLTRPQRDEETTCFKMLHLTKNAFHNFNLLSAKQAHHINELAQFFTS